MFARSVSCSAPPREIVDWMTQMAHKAHDFQQVGSFKEVEEIDEILLYDGP
jgi:hypothetical protein